MGRVLVTTLLQPTAVALDATIALGRSVLVRDGVIEQVGGNAATADRTQVLDGTLLPGAIDLQVNGAGGHSVGEADDAALDEVARAVLAGGAVAFLPTMITAPFPRLLERLERVAAWIARGRHRFAVPLGIHLEGPFLATAGAHLEAHFVDPTPERIAAVLASARGQLRLVTLAHSRAGAPAAVAQLRAEGVQVALGHCSTITGFDACVAAGAGLVTHVFNAMGPMHHRDVGVGGHALDQERVACSLIVDGTHLHPAWVRNAFRCLGVDRTVLVTDSVAAAGMPDGEYRLGDQPVQLHRGVVRDAAGHLAGSALTMRAAVANWLAFVPASGPWTIARLAAANPARLLGDPRRGRIAPGCVADFGLLKADGELSAIRILPPG